MNVHRKGGANMLSDPRKALLISLIFVILPLFWFAALAFDADAAFDAVGDAGPPITFLSIVIFFIGAAVALVFRRLAAIKSELLAGRRVIARWRVGRQASRRFSHYADEEDEKDKKQTLYIVLGFLFVAFGGVALFDRKAAPTMLAIGAGVAILTILAYWLGRRATAAHLEFRTGEMIVGERGLLCDGVLHAWDVPLSWLADASLGPMALEVTYAYYARSGAQYVTARLPVSDAPEAATTALKGLRRVIEAK